MPAGRARAGHAIAALLLVAGLLAACTGDDEPAAPATTTTTGAPIEGGTLRLGLAGDPVVDPLDASLATSSQLMVLDLLHDGLTRLGDDGTAQPGLATRWVGNDDRTAFRFRLDPTRTFTSGEPITSADVIASLERVMAAGDTSLTALSLEAVRGFRAFATGEAEHVSGLTAPTDDTVRIELAAPLGILPEILSNPLLSVVDVDTVEAQDATSVDLSGAWAVAPDDLEGGGLLLERRDGSVGHLDAVELHAFDDEDDAFDAFEQGEVEWAEVPSTRYDEAVENHGDEHLAPFQAELFFGMNLSGPNLRSPAIRSAIALAIDRDAIVEQVYAGLADPLTSVVPVGVVGHDPDRCPDCAHDPEAAALLVDLVAADGEVPTIRIDFDESDPQDQMAALVATDLEAVGIPTELRPRPLEEYKSFIVSGDQELFSFGWIGAYGSPDAYLAPLFGSAANDNLTDFRSAEVDGLLARARAGTDPAQNAERWQVAETQILESWVVVPIAQFRTQVVVADHVLGFAHAVDGTVDWTEVQLSG